MKALVLTFSLLGLAMSLQAANAICILPVPDGSDPEPSPPNLHGHISGVGPGYVVIKQADTKRPFRVELPAEPEIYTAFGGDVNPKQLAVGQIAWVWFQGCVPPKQGLPISAYLKIFSVDPNDHP